MRKSRERWKENKEYLEKTIGGVGEVWILKAAAEVLWRGMKKEICFQKGEKNVIKGKEEEVACWH